jgi:hypothetical protein
MALLDFETALGRLVRQPKSAAALRLLHLDDSEISCLETLKASAGFRFTTEVQRSWCVGRAARAGFFTLSILPKDVRDEVLDAWTEAGGGTSSFFAAEAEAFLEFIAGRLPDPSHELTACRFEQATLRANERRKSFTPPDPDLLADSRCVLRRGRHAGMVAFYGDPHRIIEALVKHQPLPPAPSNVTTMLFGPGLAQSCRMASQREVAIWQTLQTPVPFFTLLGEAYRRDELARMLQDGIVEFAGQPSS